MAINELDNEREDRKKRLDGMQGAPLNPQEWKEMCAGVDPDLPCFSKEDWARITATVAYLGVANHQLQMQLKHMGAQIQQQNTVIAATCKAGGGFLIVKKQYMKDFGKDAKLNIEDKPEYIKFTLDEPKKLVLPPGALG